MRRDNLLSLGSAALVDGNGRDRRASGELHLSTPFRVPRWLGISQPAWTEKRGGFLALSAISCARIALSDQVA